MITGTDDIKKVQALVGDITEDDLRHVDYYVADNFGIFIPSVGSLQEFYKAFVVFRLKNGKATTWTMETNFAPKEYIQL